MIFQLPILLSEFLNFGYLPTHHYILFLFILLCIYLGEEPETWTLAQFGTNYLIYLLGQTIANIHIALVYCPTMEQQILFSVGITIWMLPIYTVIVFTGYIFAQFCRTLTENYRQLRYDIGLKSKQVKKRNLFYTEVIKKGLPRRYDRLHDNLEQVADVFDNAIFFDYFFNVTALLVSDAI